jgi:DNA polymerase-1
VRTPEGQRIRQAFIAEPGNELISADWSQIELRVLAHFSRDPALLDSFRRGLDVHRRTASELFHVPFEEVTAAQRGVGKTINFATIYGQGATALSQTSASSARRRSATSSTTSRPTPACASGLDETIAQAKERGYVTTLLGGRGWTPSCPALAHGRAGGRAHRGQHPIQGSAADLCKLAMLQSPRGCASRREGEAAAAGARRAGAGGAGGGGRGGPALVRGAMEKPWPLEVPLVVNLASAAAGRGALRRGARQFVQRPVAQLPASPASPASPRSAGVSDSLLLFVSSPAPSPAKLGGWR